MNKNMKMQQQKTQKLNRSKKQNEFTYVILSFSLNLTNLVFENTKISQTLMLWVSPRVCRLAYRSGS